jgi:agmatine deiminase
MEKSWNHRFKMDTCDHFKLRMPAEWEKHEATWLSWPKNETTFPGSTLEKVKQTFAEMIEALAPGERVNVLVDSEKQEFDASSRISTKGDVIFFKDRTEDVWIRDYGPIFVRKTASEGSHSEVIALKWIFNAWGRKYDDLMADNANGRVVSTLAGVRTVEPGIVLEGGSIDVNGQGTLLTTKQCLLNGNRSGLSREKLENYLGQFLGAENVIWLGNGIEGDDTDGHVDDVARFVSSSTVICMTDHDNEVNSAALQENLTTLSHSANENGESLEVLSIEMPRRRISDSEGNPLPASYANFYIGNAAVLVPTFEDENDGKALEKIAPHFPGRRTLGINCEALVSGFGGIHCVTQQQPAA